MMPAHVTRLMTFAQHGQPAGYAASDMMRSDLEALILAAAGKAEDMELVGYIGLDAAQRLETINLGLPTTITKHVAFNDDVALWRRKA